MSVKFQPVQWNRNKYLYDAVLIVMVAVYVLVFLNVAPMFQDVTRPVDGATYRMKAFGTCAFLLLTVILCIGPLARLDRRFLPLLYNRRHFGVITCTVAFVHADQVLRWYFAFSDTDPYVALLSANTSYGQIVGFPFEVFGIFALLTLLVLAATSHDFWLKFLGPPLWKGIHMSIYAAYAAIVLHVSLGALQESRGPVLPIVVGLSVAAVATLHLLAAHRARIEEEDAAGASDDAPWLVAGDARDIPDKRALVIPLEGDERVAIFRYDGKLSAVTNLCAHQNGPLGEGQIKFGCITCPWHGFQYNPEDGRAPAPFTEKIATYRLRLDGTTVLLDPRALAPGTRVEPVLLPEGLA